jgi:hypothetical protein
MSLTQPSRSPDGYASSARRAAVLLSSLLSAVPERLIRRVG